MVEYVIWIRYFNRTVTYIKQFESKNDFYAYIGWLYLSSIESIERIDYYTREALK